MTYTRIETAAGLPPEGSLNDRAREKSDLDFKTFADKATMWEHAKDVAAFANALGGVIVVGGDIESAPGQLLYPGIVGQTVKQVEKLYNDAAQLCSPSPVVDVVPIPLDPKRSVVAVNVEPYLDQLVASPAKIRDDHGNPSIQKDAWVFPVRQAAQTEWIKPENLAMYMNRDVRRAVLMLAKIPADKRASVRVSFHKKDKRGNPLHSAEPYRVPHMDLALGEISVEHNFLAIVKNTGSATCTCHVPLTEVLDVWRQETGEWHVLLRGGLSESQTDHRAGSLDYVVNPRI